MIILGIDPGTAALGYGIVERTGGSLRAVDHGVVVTSPDLALGERLLAIHTALADLIATHAPSIVAVERLYFSRNAQTAMAVGHARGVVLLAAAEGRVPVREATPSEVKSAVAGHGAADKEQVGRMVALVLGMAAVPTPDDAADALAIAVCIANGLGQVGRGSRPDGAAVLDRGAAAPIARGSSPYERAVREALAREGGVRRR
ncbi:MAG TPA: crossover junction endodeoxyribonuclease RuvC [Candidatus Limnocylindrales bacterium]|nr:crossover junction endodeoxyribonuclease RuvC [Candidatus Limnocylindrales bacterium]